MELYDQDILHMLRTQFGLTSPLLTSFLEENKNFPVTLESLRDFNERQTNQEYEVLTLKGKAYVTGQLIEDNLEVLKTLSTVPGVMGDTPRAIPVDDIPSNTMPQEFEELLCILFGGIRTDIRAVAKELGAEALVNLRISYTKPLTYMATPVRKKHS